MPRACAQPALLVAASQPQHGTGGFTRLMQRARKPPTGPGIEAVNLLEVAEVCNLLEDTVGAYQLLR